MCRFKWCLDMSEVGNGKISRVRFPFQRRLNKLSLVDHFTKAPYHPYHHHHHHHHHRDSFISFHSFISFSRFVRNFRIFFLFSGGKLRKPKIFRHIEKKVDNYRKIRNSSWWHNRLLYFFQRFHVRKRFCNPLFNFGPS